MTRSVSFLHTRPAYSYTTVESLYDDMNARYESVESITVFRDGRVAVRASEAAFLATSYFVMIYEVAADGTLALTETLRFDDDPRLAETVLQSAEQGMTLTEALRDLSYPQSTIANFMNVDKPNSVMERVIKLFKKLF